MQTRHTAGYLASFVAWMFAAAPMAAACDFCHDLGGNPLALPHPRAIEVAVATRAAIEEGALRNRSSISRDLLPDGGPGQVALHKVSAPAIVEAWAARLARSKLECPPLAVHLVFIDTDQTCELIVRGGTVLFDGNPSFHATSRIVTTRAAWLALLEGSLSVSDARRLGLLLVEGDECAAALVAGSSRIASGGDPSRTFDRQNVLRPKETLLPLSEAQR